MVGSMSPAGATSEDAVAVGRQMASGEFADDRDRQRLAGRVAKAKELAAAFERAMERLNNK